MCKRPSRLSDAICRQLMRVRQQVKPVGLIPADGPPKAQELVESDPFAFLMAGCLDRGMPAEIIWGLPYCLKRVLGHLDPCRLAAMTEGEIRSDLYQLDKKPRYINAAPRTVSQVSQMVCKEFGGKAEALWHNTSARKVQDRLRQIYGVGPGIASMIVILLERLRWAHFEDLYDVNVKPDVHVQRVMYRLGLVDRMSEAEAICAARALSPHYPGELDTPLWWIGKHWCFDTNSECGKCPMDDLCPKRGLRETNL